MDLPKRLLRYDLFTVVSAPSCERKEQRGANDREFFNVYIGLPFLCVLVYLQILSALERLKRSCQHLSDWSHNSVPDQPDR